MDTIVLVLLSFLPLHGKNIRAKVGKVGHTSHQSLLKICIIKQFIVDYFLAL